MLLPQDKRAACDEILPTKQFSPVTRLLGHGVPACRLSRARLLEAMHGRNNDNA